MMEKYDAQILKDIALKLESMASSLKSIVALIYKIIKNNK